METRNFENMVRVATITPIVHIGNIEKNMEEILSKVKELRNRHDDIGIFVTPELSLTGYSCQDMFNNKTLLEQLTLRNIYRMYCQVNHSMNFIAKDDEDPFYIVMGSPVYENGFLFNCSIVINAVNNKIMGVVPKTYLPNYNEYYEGRWFTSGKSKAALDIKEIKISDYDSRYEMNVPFGTDLIFQSGNVKFGIEICEDLWSPIPPSGELAIAGANIIINNSASNEVIGKSNYRLNLVSQQSARCICGYVYCSAGLTESTQDVVFSGHSIIAENGTILSRSKKFLWEDYLVCDIDLDRIMHDRVANKTFSNTSDYASTQSFRFIEMPKINTTLKYLFRSIKMYPFVPEKNVEERCMDIFEMQVAGLARRLKETNSKKLVIGVSGGLDSTLALLVCVAAAVKCGKDAGTVLGVTMPCFGTTNRTKSNALKLMEVLGCDTKEINIGDSVKQHLKDIGLSEDDRSVAYENAQARERTQVLMDIANMSGGFVVGTGDLSEQALGWATFNGDHISMYNVNGSIPKTLVRSLVKHIGHKLHDLGYMKKGRYSKELINVIDDILSTPISPELLPPINGNEIVQLTEDSVGPYVLNDFFIYYTIRFGMKPSKIVSLALAASEEADMNFSEEEIIKWLKKFYIRFKKAQFKRNVCADGLKVGTVSFNPRGDWRMASEFDIDAFLKDCK